MKRCALCRAWCLVLALAMLLTMGCAGRRLTDALTPQEHVQLGMAYEFQNEKEKARKEYLLAAGSEPLALMYLGNMGFAAGQEDEALRYYRQAQELLPDNAHLNNNLAWLLFTIGQRRNDAVQMAEAESLAQKAVAAAPPELLPHCKDTLQQVQAAMKKSRGGKGAREAPPLVKTVAPASSGASAPQKQLKTEPAPAKEVKDTKDAKGAEEDLKLSLNPQ